MSEEKQGYFFIDSDEAKEWPRGEQIDLYHFTSVTSDDYKGKIRRDNKIALRNTSEYTLEFRIDAYFMPKKISDKIRTCQPKNTIIIKYPTNRRIVIYCRRKKL